METLAPAPANAENTAPVETAKPDGEAVETTSGDSASPVPEADTSAPKVKEDPVQKRIDTLTREKYDALRERDRRDYEIERLRAEVEQFRTAKPTEVAPQPDFPTLEQFGYDEGKFNSAVAAHYSKLATEQARQVAREQVQQERAALQVEQAAKNWASKEAEFIKSKPDYAEKVRDNRDLRITKDMAEVIRDSDLGPQVAYYLGENPDKSALIASLPPLAQARELGRIEGSLEIKKAPPVSKAPPPVSKVEVTESVVPFDPADPASDKLSTDEWVRRRNKQLRKR